MHGYPDQVFCPDEALSCTMLVQVRYNLEGRPAVEGVNAYSDTAEDAWYEDAILWADQNDIVGRYVLRNIRSEQNLRP